MTTLREIALKHGTDKAGGSTDPGRHEYCEAYEQFLGHLRWHTDSAGITRPNVFTLLELGVGGEEHPDRGGQSLRTWREYFPHARIHGVDLYEKTFQVPGCEIHMGSQDDVDFLQNLIKKIGHPEVIIDDASHVNIMTVSSFMILFPMLKPGGIYVVEDVHTSYWERIYGGGWHTLTAMEYFKHQADGLNEMHWRESKPCHWLPDLMPGIESITFFKEIIFIRKKL